MLSTDKLLRRHDVSKTVVRPTFSCHVSKWGSGSCRGRHKHGRVVEAVYGEPR